MVLSTDFSSPHLQHTHTRTHTCTHMCTHIHAHTCAHTYVHTHALAYSGFFPFFLKELLFCREGIFLSPFSVVCLVLMMPLAQCHPNGSLLNSLLVSPGYQGPQTAFLPILLSIQHYFYPGSYLGYNPKLLKKLVFFRVKLYCCDQRHLLMWE